MCDVKCEGLAGRGRLCWNVGRNYKGRLSWCVKWECGGSARMWGRYQWYVDFGCTGALLHSVWLVLQKSCDSLEFETIVRLCLGHVLVVVKFNSE